MTDTSERTCAITYPKTKVKLTGTDGNVFAIIGAVSKAIRRDHGGEAASAFTREAMTMHSYSDVLVFCMRTVVVS